MGGEALLRKIIGVYFDSAPPLLKSLRATLQGGDPEAARRAVHTLKSSSANLGASSLSELCRAIEANARAGNFQPDAIAAIETEYARVVQTLQHHLESLPS